MKTFTIITPTVLRESLLRTCRSVNEQNFQDWQHIVMVDRPENLLTESQQSLLMHVAHPNREVRFCSSSHKDFGNTCRRNAVDFAIGDWILYMDDDDYYLPDAFEAIHSGIAASPDFVWGVFPIRRFGKMFFSIPPGHSRTCNNQFFHRPRVNGVDLRYPSAGYCADGEFVELLMRNYPFNCVNPGRPLAVVEESNFAFRVPIDRPSFEAAFRDYVENYSIETEAISLASSYYLLDTLHDGKIQTVLDLGTGWSSYLFRFYKKHFAPGMEICSVDESEHWLGTTVRFLAKHNLDTCNLRLWPSTGERSYDLVFLDMGRPWERHLHLSRVLEQAEGMLVCDDMHYEKYRSQLQSAADAVGLALKPLPQTMDRFGRYMGLVERSPQASSRTP